MALFNLRTRLAKVQTSTLALAALSELLLLIATLTPAWQVAEDTDVGRSIQSGLWVYCPGTGTQCWYIFSDDLINYYERVDVCRFLLIGDCRKKLLRTPYFFGWHYAVLIILLSTMALGAGAMAALGIGMTRPHVRRVTTVVLDALLAFAFLLLCIGLAVFLINAEMLESRYLIGVKNTFEKHYGYSFFLACIAATVMLFALMMAVMLTSSVFLLRNGDAGAPFPDEGMRSPDGRMDFDAAGMQKLAMLRDYQYHQGTEQQTPMPRIITNYPPALPPRFGYSPSDVTSIP